MSEPYARLFYNGTDITGDIEGDVLSLDWTDNLHGKADELAVKLQDADGKWRGAWRPQKGDMVAATIGYLGGPSIDCGTFEVDIPEAGGNRSGDHLSFKAVSAPHSAALRSQRSGMDEDTDLRRIIARRAGRNGLGVTGSIEAVPFAYKRQRRERDLAFVKRLAEDYGHFVSIKSRQLIFYRRDELEAAGAVRTFELADIRQTIVDLSSRGVPDPIGAGLLQ